MYTENASCRLKGYACSAYNGCVIATMKKGDYD